MKRYIIGVDEGTTSTRAILYDINKNQIIEMSSRAFKSYYPQSGWVEQDAESIWKKVYACIKDVAYKVPQEEIIGLGITNQRETVVAWNKKTGKAVCPAIVWQCRRTADDIEKISPAVKRKIKQKTGLIADAYFSASKIKWLLNNEPKVQELLKEDNLCVGTIDSYLAYKMTGKFVTDTTNASRTMLFNINTLAWDEELLKYFNIPKGILPNVISSAEIVGNVKGFSFPLASLIGDQQSSLVGQGCFNTGRAKATYGTGGFILFNTGSSPAYVDNILTTVAYTINKKTCYALEGSIYSASSTVNYMQNNLGLFENPKQTENMAKKVASTNGVYFVPAFTGLGAPYWDSNARAIICGINFDTNKNHIVRAGLESMAYNTRAIFDQMQKGGIVLSEIKVDGGCSKNKFLLQFLADITGTKVVKNKESEATAMGAVFTTALATKTLNITQIKKRILSGLTYNPIMQSRERNELFLGWQKAVDRAIKE